MKSFRKQGSRVACEAISRFRSEPWKYCFVGQHRKRRSPGRLQVPAPVRPPENPRGSALSTAKPSSARRSRLRPSADRLQGIAKSSRLVMLRCQPRARSSADALAAAILRRVAAMISSSLVGTGCKKYTCWRAGQYWPSGSHLSRDPALLSASAGSAKVASTCSASYSADGVCLLPQKVVASSGKNTISIAGFLEYSVSYLQRQAVRIWRHISTPWGRRPM